MAQTNDKRTDTDILFNMRKELQKEGKNNESLFILDKAAICLAFAEWTESIVQLIHSHLKDRSDIELAFLAERNIKNVRTSSTRDELVSKLRAQFRDNFSSPTLNRLYEQATKYEMTKLKNRLQQLDPDYLVLVLIFWKIRCHIAHSSEKQPFPIKEITLNMTDTGVLSYEITNLGDQNRRKGTIDQHGDHYQLKGVVIGVQKYENRLCFCSFIVADTAKKLQESLNEVLEYLKG